MIAPARLTDQDRDEASVVMSGDNLTSISGQRDVIMEYGGDSGFVLIGIENQMRVHYGIDEAFIQKLQTKYKLSGKDAEKLI